MRRFPLIVEIRSSIYSLTQVLDTQIDKDDMVKVNPNASTTSSRIRNFTRINNPKFFDSKVEEYPQEFIDEVFKGGDAMRVTSQEKVKLVVYQLKEVA